MGNELRGCGAVIGYFPPDVTHNPLTISAILREIVFITVFVETP